MNDLITVEGTNAEFCDVTIVRDVLSNGKKEIQYPTNFKPFLLKNKMYNNQTKKINVLTLCMRRLLNLCWDFYGREYSGHASIHTDMQNELNEIIKYIPEKYIEIKMHEIKFDSPWSFPSPWSLQMFYDKEPYTRKEIQFEIIKIKPQGIAYLEQKKDMNVNTEICPKCYSIDFVKRNLNNSKCPYCKSENIKKLDDDLFICSNCNKKFLNPKIIKYICKTCQNIFDKPKISETESPLKRLPKIINILREMSKSKTNIDFDEYIDDWAKRLMKGDTE